MPCHTQEKNANVGKAASESLSIMHRYCWSLLDMGEDLTGEPACASCGAAAPAERCVRKRGDIHRMESLCDMPSSSLRLRLPLQLR